MWFLSSIVTLFLSCMPYKMDKAQGLTTRPILYILKHIWKLNEQKVKELFTIGRDLDEQDRKLLIEQA